MTAFMRHSLTSAACPERGFTLVEAVMVIAITGILAAMVAVFITSPVVGYVDTARRAEIADAADVSLRRLEREVRLALPNSVRVGSNATYNYIEFIPTTAGGRYRDAGDGSTGGLPLVFSDSTGCGTAPNNCKFDVLGPMPSNPTLASGASGDYIVVFNLGSGYSPADAYTGGNRAQVSAVSGNTVTLAANPFADATHPPLPSPESRFQVVPFALKAVTYECPKSVPGDLTRYWDYGFNASAPTSPPGGRSAIAMSNVTCTVGYSQNVSFRNALLYIKLIVSDPGASGERIEVFQQIHVDNSP